MNFAHDQWREAHALNVAAKAMGLGLAGMTQARWDAMTEMEKHTLRDLSGLTKALIPYEGCRVEVIDKYGEKRRFWVGRSSGWRPCHLEIKTSRSSGGGPADMEYKSVRMISTRHERKHR